VRPKKLLRIARWEVTKNAGGVDKRTIAVAGLAIALIAVLAPAVAAQGAVLDEGIYRVGVDEDSPYHDVVADDPTFVARPDATRADLGDSVDLYVEDGRILASSSPKGAAAKEELRSSVQAYNNDQLRLETNQTAAFPISVTLEYRDQSGVGTTLAADDGDRQTDRAGDNQTDGETPTDGNETTNETTDGTSGTDGTDGTSGTDGTDGTAGGPNSGGVDGGESVVSGGSGDSVDSPSQLSPPFPFESLVLAFVFIIPMNFLIQAYGSTILSERLNRRGELLLVSPVSRYEIIGGKTLPYFAGAMAIESLIAVALTYVASGTIGGAVSVAAIVPLVALFLAATFVGAMFARSFKELTFVTVTITVGLTSYAFVPAIFTDVTPIALISPLTVVVRDLQGQAVAAPEFVFSITPPLLSAAVLFGLGAGLYREEDMFAQRAIPLKVLDALAGPIRERWQVGAVVAVLLPFVFVLQLLAIAVLFALGEVSIPLLLVVVAVVEEIAKSLPVYAAYAHKRFERTTVTALVLGAIAGAGFFVGEKLTQIAQLVGLPELQQGQAALQIVPADQVGVPILVGLFFLPLLLHVVTAAISAVGASRGKRAYAAALGVAMLVHLLYNLAVLSAVIENV